MVQIQEIIQELIKEYKLSYKQALFVYHYTGNATEAGQHAGYKNPAECSRLLQKSTIQDAIIYVNKRKNGQSICTRDEILELYTSIARDTKSNNSERLRALDSLARTNGMFIDRQQIQSQIEYLDRLSDTELRNKVLELLEIVRTGGIPLELPEKT